MIPYKSKWHHSGDPKCKTVKLIFTSATRFCNLSCLLVGWCLHSLVCVHSVFMCSLACVGAEYLKMVTDRGSVPMDYQQEIAYGESNVMWPMTSRGPERSRSWLWYVWDQYLKRLQIYRLGCNGAVSTYRKCTWSINWSHSRWSHVTLLLARRATGGLAEFAPYRHFF